MPELDPPTFRSVLPLLPPGYGMARAVLEGKSRHGRVWVDDADAPACGLVGTVEYWVLVGAPGSGAFDEELARVIEEVVLPGGAIDEDDDEIVLYAADGAWEARYPTLFGGRDLLRDPRRYLEVEPAGLAGCPLPDGYTAREVDAGFLERAAEGNAASIRTWIDSHHRSRDEFLERCTATVIEHDGEPASWCVTDCRDDDDVAEVGIATDEAHRRRGLAAAATALTCARLFERGVRRVGWQCYTRNIGSVRTAARVGFQAVRDYPARFLMFDPDRHERVRGWCLLEIEDDAEAALAHLETVVTVGDEDDAQWIAVAARAAGRAGRVEDAFRHLRAALDAGWEPGEEGRGHADFTALRADPRWGELMASGGAQDPPPAG